MTTRYAIVSGAHEDTVRTYLPGNYFVVGSYHGKVVIAGEDRAGWTLENYVIPRLFSGAYSCQEMFTQEDVNLAIELRVRPDKNTLDRIAHLLSAPEWPGASGMEDVAEIVSTVRDITTNPDAEWPRH